MRESIIMHLPIHTLIRICCVALITVTFSCAPRHTESFDFHNPGPTLLSKDPAGYVLRNRDIRVVIGEESGDVSYWGSTDGKHNLLAAAGARASIEGEPSAPTAGYLEKRDEETWQYLGEAKGAFAWRKIYCLHGNSLYVSYLVENLHDQPLDLVLTVRADWPTSADQPGTRVEHGSASMELFEVTPAGPSTGSLLRSEPRPTKPHERANFTSEWKWLPLPQRPAR